MGQRVPLPPTRRSLSRLPQWGSGQSPEKFVFLAFWDLKNHIRTVGQIFCFDTAPMSRYVVNEGACM